MIKPIGCRVRWKSSATREDKIRLQEWLGYYGLRGLSTFTGSGVWLIERIMRYSIELNGKKVDEMIDRDGDEIFDPTEAKSCKLKSGEFVRLSKGDRITVVIDAV